MKPGSERPRAYANLSRFDNRRIFISVMVAGLLMIALAAGFSIYRLAFNKVVETPSPTFDLTSLQIRGEQPPAQPQVDAANPCMVLQEHLELLRRKDYGQAYNGLCTGLKSMTSLTDFTNNARLNAALFRDVQGYRFNSFQSSGTAASADGYMVYNSGGKSRVQAQFSKQPDGWKIALMTVIYQ